MTETVASPAARVRADRVARLRAELDGLGANTFLVSAPVNVEYLTGFQSTNSFALVSRERVALLTDGRYIEAAREVEGVEAIIAERELAGWLGERLADLAEPPVGFESSHVTYAAYEALARGGLELRPVAALLERLRAVKENAELDAIRRAAAITDRAYERLTNEPVVGATEAELAWRLEQILREEGADELAFPVIVASGPNGAVPHHHPGDRTIAAGETVIVDMGAKLDGYCSDCTRTFVTGPLPDDLERAYELCRRAQEESLQAVRSGAGTRDLDAIQRRMIASAGHDVLHGLGHGVGLEIHELPVLRPTATGELEPGNVVTVEPGVYLSGLGGVRIEDLVVVSEDGPEIVSRFAKEPLTLR